MIWHHAHIRVGSVIGTGCRLGKNVFVDEGVQVGDRVKIQNNVSVYQGVELSDDVFVGPSAVFTNDLRPRAASAGWRLGATRVRRGASIGANATILCGTEIGEHGMVGAGAVVTKSVLPHQLVTGNPARPSGWVCACGAVVSRAMEAPGESRCARCRTASGRDSRTAADAREEPADGVLEQRIPLAKIMLGAEEEEAVLRVLRSGAIAVGEQVRLLEDEFARAHKATHAVAVSNGTTALVLALRAHGIGPGDEVITAPLTFVATLNSILEAGATARFADVTEDLTLDPDSVRSLITERTKALMPVHLYGLPAAMREIRGIARKHGLVIIEDAAQAHGARVARVPIGSSGTAAFSFYATKNITCGEGGLVTTDDSSVANRLRLLRNHGMRARYEYAMPGYNCRLTDLQAAIAVAQLRKLPAIMAARSRNAARLSTGLANVPGLVLPAAPAGRTHAWHQYTVRVTSRTGRDMLSKHLDAAGIDSVAYYPRLVHDYPCYREHPQVVCDDTPRARQAARQVLSLPVHPGLQPGDIDRIVACVRMALAS